MRRDRFREGKIAYALDVKKQIQMTAAALYTVGGICMKLHHGNISSIFESFEFSLTMAVLLPLLAAFYRRNIERTARVLKSGRDKCCLLLPAAFLSGFMVVGASFEQENGWGLILGSAAQLLMALIRFTACFFLFKNILVFLYDVADRYEWQFRHRNGRTENNSVIGRKQDGLHWKDCQKFLFVFISLFILHLPYIVLSYPAVFWGDTPAQIAQGFNLNEETSQYLLLLSEDVRLNNHHPVFHTLLLHVFLRLGGILHSFNTGIFLFSLLQLICLFGTISLCIVRLYESGVPVRYLLMLIIYFGVAPRLQNHSMLITKDIWYGMATLLFVLFLERVTRPERDGKPSVKEMLGVFLSELLLILFRNEGIYVVVLTLILACAMGTGPRRRWIINSVSCLVVVLLIHQVIFPTFRITEGSRREMLSIPFQQTARYMKIYPDEVTDKEWDAVNAVLDAEALPELYIYTRSDPVKATFREEADSTALKGYFSAWLKMGLKHPGIYLGATINQIYQYFYPDTEYLARVPYADSAHLMEHTNRLMEDGGIRTDFHYPDRFFRFRMLYEKAGEALARFPAVSVLSRAATYLWLVLIAGFYQIRRKNRRGILLLFPLFLEILVCFAGPVGGTCFRYLYPVALSVFPAILMGMQDGKPQSTSMFEEKSKQLLE